MPVAGWLRGRPVPTAGGEGNIAGYCPQVKTFEETLKRNGLRSQRPQVRILPGAPHIYSTNQAISAGFRVNARGVANHATPRRSSDLHGARYPRKVPSPHPREVAAMVNLRPLFLARTCRARTNPARPALPYLR